MEKTTKNFKVGDKVYVYENDLIIRATIIKITPDLGYMLKTFKQDLPGLWMGRIWDHHLTLRQDKRRAS